MDFVAPDSKVTFHKNIGSNFYFLVFPFRHTKPKNRSPIKDLFQIDSPKYLQLRSSYRKAKSPKYQSYETSSEINPIQ